jgi:hypothetical protein
MKQAKKTADGMRAEYDFSKGVRGKYFDRYRRSTNVVVLDPDVSEMFPNTESVNEALRALASLARRAGVPAKRASASKGRRSNKRMQLTKRT